MEKTLTSQDFPRQHQGKSTCHKDWDEEIIFLKTKKELQKTAGFPAPKTNVYQISMQYLWYDVNTVTIKSQCAEKLQRTVIKMQNTYAQFISSIPPSN